MSGIAACTATDTWHRGITQLDEPGPFGRWSESYDAVLYLGPQDLQLRQPVPAYLWLDSSYAHELHREASLPGAATNRATELLDAHKVVDAEANPFICSAPGTAGQPRR